ncbi:MAG TPA: DUF2298 domain-containing protein, partial [Dehalococcoidia bacterium]|nr:DUF2298 domain-containing protein [Dehalococcoidia bacterium]
MKETLVFWLAIEGIGLAAFPLTFALFSGLRDRGYAFGKVVGLLLVSYVLWISATVGILPNSRGSIILILLVLAAVSTVIAGRRGQELRNFLSNGLEYILLVEGLFLLVFGFGVYLRSFAPDIIWGEKPFELAFLNSVNRGEFFPPADPWLSGETISYYYFGYVQTVVLTKLSGLSTATSFYLMLCLT